MSLFHKNPLMQAATSLFCVLSIVMLSTGIAAAANPSPSASNASTNNTSATVAPLVQFLSPASSATVESTTVQVKLRLNGPGINSRALKIYANNQDVTSSFVIGDCPWGLCEISGQLTLGSQLKSGWNHLRATVTTKSGAVSRGLLAFYEKVGLLGASKAADLPKAIHVAMSPTQGIEVDYTPDGGNAPYFYPGDHQCASPGGLTIIDLERITLAWKASTCFNHGSSDNAALQSYLATLTKDDLVLASTVPGGPLGALNLSLIGGTDFTQSNAPQAYSYSIIGYGQAGAGVASESYNTSSAAAWHSLEGNLVDIGVSYTNSEGVIGDFYGFQPTGSAGFAVVPHGLNASVTVGNTQQLPTGTTTPLTNVPAGFTNVTYSAPPAADSSGGLWMLVLDRYTLQLISSTTYSTDNPDGSENENQMQNLWNDISQLDNNSHLVFITTLAGNYNPETSFPLVNSDQPQYRNVLYAIMQMGVSPYAFDRQMGGQQGINHPGNAPPPSPFSMVGVPSQFIENNFPYDQTPSNNSCTLPATATRVCGANKNQWFSSALDTQQNETGALQGTLTHNRAYQYTPTEVHPFTPANGATADDLLSNSIASAVAAAPLVAWPMTDTPGHQAAYAYLSSVLVANDMQAGAATCTFSDPRACNDIRSYYTSGQASLIYEGKTSIAPDSISCPTDNGQFTQSECQDVRSQLQKEVGMLLPIANFQTMMEKINTQSTTNLALSLNKAANDVSKQVSDAIPNAEVGADPMSLSIDSLGLASGFAGLVGVAFPPASVLSGLLATAGGIVSLVKDSQGSSTDNSAVRYLGDLLTTDEEKASDAASNFNTSLYNASELFFDVVLSDWFKMEAISTLSTNLDNQGSWYYDAHIDATTYTPFLQAAARKNFYEQILSQHFGTVYIRAFGYAPLYPQWNVIPKIFPDTDSLWQWVVGAGGLYGTDHHYSRWNRDALPGYYTGAGDNGPETHYIQDGLWDFNFVVLNNNNDQSWTDSLGDTLMGPPTALDGSGNLNLNRDMLYDSGTFPTIISYWEPLHNVWW